MATQKTSASTSLRRAVTSSRPFTTSSQPWPVIGHGHDKLGYEKAALAMAARGKNKHYKLQEIQRRHFNNTARSIGVGENAEPLISDILAATPAVISRVQTVIPAQFPQHVLESILRGLENSVKRLEAMLSAS